MFHSPQNLRFSIKGSARKFKSHIWEVLPLLEDFHQKKIENKKVMSYSYSTGLPNVREKKRRPGDISSIPKSFFLCFTVFACGGRLLLSNWSKSHFIFLLFFCPSLILLLTVPKFEVITISLLILILLMLILILFSCYLG